MCIYTDKIKSLHPTIEIVSKDPKIELKTKHRVELKTKYGNCNVIVEELLNGCKPSIRSAINKTEYCINQFKEVHGDTYDYSLVKYVNNYEPLNIICKIHGIFPQSADKHLNSKRGCHKCGRIKSKESNTEDFDYYKQKSFDKFGDKFSFEKYTFINRVTESTLICKKHQHSFEITMKQHVVKNGGCILCKKENSGYSHSIWKEAGENSSNFDGFKLYVIRCWNDTEEFYKFGKTFVTIKERYTGKTAMPYNYEIFKIVTGDANYISKLEDTYQRMLKKYHYSPLIKFKGSKHECFKI